MLEIMQFVFQDFWHFIGSVIIIGMFLDVPVEFHKEWHKYNNRPKIQVVNEYHKNYDPSFLVDPVIHCKTTDGNKFDIHSY